MNGSQDTERTIERVARESYGRLVAYLSSHTRDVASAEDALSNALIAALTTWPRDGVPQSPEDSSASQKGVQRGDYVG